MGIQMSKPWAKLSSEVIADVPAQLGVYEVADPVFAVLTIGYAGGKEPFGMRTALERELESGATHFRYEFTHGYLTRWHELLMTYQAEHDELPPGNAEQIGKLGRLRPLENALGKTAGSRGTN